jgi:PAS domain S-box-containing protein
MLLDAASTYRRLVESSPDPVISVDVEGRVVVWNPAAERVFGWSGEEAMGEVLPIVPDDLRDETDLLRTRVLSGERVDPVFTKRRRKDGVLIDVSISLFPMLDDSDAVVGVSGIVRDRTEAIAQKRLIEGLLAVTQTFSRTLSRSEVLDLVFHEVTERLRLDGAAFLRHDPSTDRLVPERTLGDGLDRLPAEGFAMAQLPSVVWAVTHRRILAVPDVAEIPRDGQLALLPDHARAVVGIPVQVDEVLMGMLVGGNRQPRAFTAEEEALAGALGDEVAVALHRADLVAQLSHEVREERAEVERLAAMDQVRTEVVATVSHDLRSPLTAIKGFVSMLLRHDGDIDGSERRDILSVVDRQASRLGRMIDNLLTASEVEAGVHRVAALAPVRVEPVLREVAEEAAGLSERHRIDVDVADRNLCVQADEDYFRRVVANLVDNAIKYSPEGGRVTLSGRAGGDRVRLCVVDEGPGIPPEIADRLFSRFVRHPGRNGGVASTGLGLFIVRRLVEDMGGKVSVESRPGRGATFVLDLACPPSSLRSLGSA